MSLFSELRALTLAHSPTHSLTSPLLSSLPLTHIGDGNCHLLRTHIGDGDGDLTLSLWADVLHLHLSLSVTYLNRRSSPPVRQISQFSSAFLKSIYREMTSQRVQSMKKKFCFHFQDYVDLVIWKVQFLDRHHLLIKFGSVDGGKPAEVGEKLRVERKATCEEAGKACDHIFLWAFGKYQKVEGIVESVTNNKNKIILLIQRKEKMWKIPFSLSAVTWPRGEEPYADEAFELLGRSIVDKRVEVLLEKFDSDSDGYFVGTLLLESNTHVAIPLVKAGLAKLEGPSYPKGYRNQLKQVQIPVQMKSMKIWENSSAKKSIDVGL